MEVKPIEVKTRIIGMLAILFTQDLSRLLLALLVKSTLPRGESKNGLKCTPKVGHARSAKILRQKRVIRNYLAAS